MQTVWTFLVYFGYWGGGLRTPRAQTPPCVRACISYQLPDRKLIDSKHK